MCGIAAIFSYRSSAPAVNEGELLAIRDYMTARGPDGAGLWYDLHRRVGLGHRRLSILDLSEAGAQPMLLPERQLAITFNGEIYNYRALRAELEKKGHVFHSTCDTEVLLHLYAEHGEDMVKNLRGMYAFVLWDGLKRGLFLARDPYGIKPLYVADDGHTLRVASQVKALLAGGKIDTAPEPAGHVGFFLWGHMPDPYTLYRGIRALAAGNSLWLDEDGSRRERAFCTIPEILRSAANAAPAGIEPQAANLGAALRDTVAHHLISDVPVGVFLSSGLDSTTLAALAAEQGGALHTVTLGFEEFRGTGNDETPLAELVARQYGARHQTVWVKRRDFQDHGERLFAAMDQPSTDGVNSYFVSHAAKQASLKVALSGLGGDELFGGYPSFAEIPRAVNALGFLPPGTRVGALFRNVTAPVLRCFTSPKYAGLLEYGGSYGGAYLLRRGMFMPWELPGLLDPDLVREGWAKLNTLAALNATFAPVPPCSDPLSPRLRVSALESCWYMRNQLLRDADWAGMAHSLEIRVPLVDTTLLRSVLLSQGSANPLTKQSMASAPRLPLPKGLLTRAKTGFTIPVRDWLMTSDSSSGVRSSVGEARGLRLWAREVHSRFPSADCVLARKHPIGKRRSEGGRLTPRVEGQSARTVAPLSFVAAERPAFAPESATRESSDPAAPKRVLVFRIGQLGDTIVSLPSFWVIRKQFPDAQITLLCDRQANSRFVFAADLLRGSTLVDDVESYPFSSTVSGRLVRPFSMIATWLRLRARRFDTVVYLAPSGRTSLQERRDRRFFAALGIRSIIGLNSQHTNRAMDAPGDHAFWPFEADLLLARLGEAGLTVPGTGKGCMDLQLGTEEDRAVNTWLKQQLGDGGRAWIGLGPGSKMPAKRWSEERFQAVVANLIAQFDIWPVIFGGLEDVETANRLLRAWGRGYNAAGQLGIRAAAFALRRCVLYLGNDTGTMHLAAAVGTPCLAVFSARDYPGRWYPYGTEHRVFRVNIECQYCGLLECNDRKNECLKRISVAEVLAGCQAVLRTGRGNAPSSTSSTNSQTTTLTS